MTDRRFSEEQESRTLTALDAHDANYVLEPAEFLYVRPEAEQRLRAIVGSHFAARHDGQSDGASAILGTLRPTPAPSSYANVSVFDAEISVATIAAEIGNDIAVVENSIADTHRHTGEIFLRGISKADGIAVAIEDLGISQAHTIAIGDGESDLEMVAYAGIGITVEGSHPGLVALADRTTPPPSKDGVAVAFAELGLI